MHNSSRRGLETNNSKCSSTLCTRQCYWYRFIQMFIKELDSGIRSSFSSPYYQIHWNRKATTQWNSSQFSKRHCSQEISDQRTDGIDEPQFIRERNKRLSPIPEIKRQRAGKKTKEAPHPPRCASSLTTSHCSLPPPLAKRTRRRGKREGTTAETGLCKRCLKPPVNSGRRPERTVGVVGSSSARVSRFSRAQQKPPH